MPYADSGEDVFTITKNMVSEGSYAGPPIGINETVIISHDISLIRFPDFLEAKGVTFGRGTEIYLSNGGKVRHFKCGGTMACRGNLFAGAIDSSSEIIVNGDLATWLGDLKTSEGNICVTGDMRSAGHVMAPAGAIAVSGTIERDGRIYSLDTWFGASGRPLSVMARSAAMKAEKTLSRLASPAAA